MVVRQNVVCRLAQKDAHKSQRNRDFLVKLTRKISSVLPSKRIGATRFYTGQSGTCQHDATSRKTPAACLAPEFSACHFSALRRDYASGKLPRRALTTGSASTPTQNKARDTNYNRNDSKYFGYQGATSNALNSPRCNHQSADNDDPGPGQFTVNKCWHSSFSSQWPQHIGNPALARPDQSGNSTCDIAPRRLLSSVKTQTARKFGHALNTYICLHPSEAASKSPLKRSAKK